MYTIFLSKTSPEDAYHRLETLVEDMFDSIESAQENIETAVRSADHTSDMTQLCEISQKIDGEMPGLLETVKCYVRRIHSLHGELCKLKKQKPQKT